MFPYWILFGLFAGGAMFARPDPDPDQSRYRLLLVLALAVIVLFVGLRFEVGTDWSAYEGMFDSIHRYSWQMVSRIGDPAFYALLKINDELGWQLWSVNLICAAILATGLLRFSRNQPNPWLTVSVAIPYLVFVVAMSGTRQATAIGFWLLALAAFSEGRLIRTMVWVLVGALFHASAILMLGLIATSYSRSRLAAALILIITLAAAFFFFSSSFDTYLERYSNVRLQSQGTGYRIAMNSLPAVIYLFQSGRFRSNPRDLALWRNLAILSLLCIPAAILAPSSTAIDRMSLYLIPLQLYVLGRLPSAYSRSGEDYRFLSAIVLLGLGLAMYVFFAFSVHGRYWVPYQSYFSV